MAEIDQAYPTRDQIESRAYEIYLERGGTDGDDVADWLNAEWELTQAENPAGSIQMEDAEKAIQEILDNSRAVAARAGS
jgi:hypothetical protein